MKLFNSNLIMEKGNKRIGATMYTAPHMEAIEIEAENTILASASVTTDSDSLEDGTMISWDEDE
jgi:hypothetical protein